MAQQYEYIVVPFVGRLKRSVFSVENASNVSQQLQDLINEQAEQGWEFHSLVDVRIQVKPGCLASWFGASTSYITFNQVVFRRTAA